jgi:hypothetical protein
VFEMLFGSGSFVVVVVLPIRNSMSISEYDGLGEQQGDCATFSANLRILHEPLSQVVPLLPAPCAVLRDGSGSTWSWWWQLVSL